MSTEEIIVNTILIVVAFGFVSFFAIGFYVFIMDEFPHDTFIRWKRKVIDEPKKQKRRELYLAPVFENHKFKKTQMQKTVFVSYGSHRVDSEKKPTHGYFFEVFQRSGTRFYSKGFHFFYFQSQSDQDQFLSVFSKYNEKNPYTDNDLLIHVLMRKPWDEPNNHIERIFKYHSHNKTY